MNHCRSVFLLGGFITLTLLLTGCDSSVGQIKDKTGRLWLVECNKGVPGRYTVRPLDGNGPVETGDFNVLDGNCPDLQAKIEAQKNGVPVPLGSQAAEAGDTRAAAATDLGLVYLLDVAGTNAVEILDPSTIKIKEVDLPANSSYPVGMALTPDGKSIWVLQAGVPANTFGVPPKPPGISIMDTTLQAFTGSFNLPDGITADSIVFSPDGVTAYISNNGQPGQNQSGVITNSTILVVDVATKTLRSTIPTPKGSGPEVMSPDGLQLYTISNNLGDSRNSILAIDTTTGTVAASASLPNGGLKIFGNPTGTRLYVFWFRGIDVFDTATLQQIASIPTVGFSFRNNFASFSPDGRTAWFCNCGYGAYYKVDMRTNQVLDTVQGSNLGVGFMFITP